MYSSQYVYDYSAAAAGAAMGVISSLISIGASILGIIAMWKIFVKAGDEGWKALIPFYNLYTLFKLTWKTKMFWIFLICVYGGVFLGMLLMGMLLMLPGIINENAVLVPLGVLLMFAGILTGLVLNIISYVKLAKSFGKSGAFAVGLVFLSLIFFCILAFDKSISYVGPQGEKTV